MIKLFSIFSDVLCVAAAQFNLRSRHRRYIERISADEDGARESAMVDCCFNFETGSRAKNDEDRDSNIRSSPGKDVRCFSIEDGVISCTSILAALIGSRGKSIGCGFFSCLLPEEVKIVVNTLVVPLG